MIEKAWVVEAIKQGAALELTRLDLRDADLRDAYLRDADLRDADLIRADLRDANLSGADLIRADLRDADLIRADLSGADLYNANLSGADLSGADLSGADLSGTILDSINPPNGNVAMFASIGIWIIGYRTQDSPVLGGDGYKTGGHKYAAPFFSTCPDTACHPGLYIRPEKEENDIMVIVNKADVHRAGGKWRCKEFVTV